MIIFLSLVLCYTYQNWLIFKYIKPEFYSGLFFIIINNDLDKISNDWSLSNIDSGKAIYANKYNRGGVFCTSKWADAPSNYGVLIVFTTNHPYIAQIFFNTVSSGSAYWRISYDRGSSWQEWHNL